MGTGNFKIFKSLKVVVFILFLLNFSSCSFCTKIALNIAAPTVCEFVEKVADIPDAELLEKALGTSACLLTGMVELVPDNFDLLTETSFFYMAYGLFEEDTNSDFAARMFVMGKKYGMRALKTNRRFRKGLEKGKKVSELVKYLGKKYLPALTWTGFNTGYAVIYKMDDPLTLVIDMPVTLALINRSMELDENFFYGACKLFYGAFYSIIPDIAGIGGGSVKALKMFESAAKVSDGKFLLVDLFKARYYAPSVNNPVLFRKILNDLTVSDAKLPKFNSINGLVKIKAKFLLEHESDYF